jgi:hypothetical protein
VRALTLELLQALDDIPEHTSYSLRSVAAHLKAALATIRSMAVLSAYVPPIALPVHRVIAPNAQLVSVESRARSAPTPRANATLTRASNEELRLLRENLLNEGEVDHTEAKQIVRRSTRTLARS